MTTLLTMLLTLTAPQTKAVVDALIGYFGGAMSFKSDLGIARDQADDMTASWEAIAVGKRTWTKWEADLVALLPRMPYTVPEGARDRGVYLRALSKLGLIPAPTMFALEATNEGTKCRDTDAMVKAILNPPPVPSPEPTPDLVAVPVLSKDLVEAAPVVSDDLVDSAPAVKLLSLTTPQWKALGIHLVAYAMDQVRGRTPPVEDVVITVDQAIKLARRLESTAVAAVTPQDMAILEAAVYLSRARDRVSAATLHTLERAWTKLGWAWEWASSEDRPSYLDQALGAEAKIRAILSPEPPPVQVSVLDKDLGDAECTSCGQMYWSGTGHPDLALCSWCWKPAPKTLIPTGDEDVGAALDQVVVRVDPSAGSAPTDPGAKTGTGWDNPDLDFGGLVRAPGTWGGPEDPAD